MKNKDKYHINFSYKKAKKFEVIKTFFEDLEQNSTEKKSDVISEAIALYAKQQNSVPLNSVIKTIELIEEIFNKTKPNFTQKEFDNIISKVITLNGTVLSDLILNPEHFIINENAFSSTTSNIENKYTHTMEKTPKNKVFDESLIVEEDTLIYNLEENTVERKTNSKITNEVTSNQNSQLTNEVLNEYNDIEDFL